MVNPSEPTWDPEVMKRMGNPLGLAGPGDQGRSSAEREGRKPHALKVDFNSKLPKTTYSKLIHQTLIKSSLGNP